MNPLGVVAPALPGDQVAAFVLLDLALILVAARLVGGVFVRLRQPRVVGEIVAGVLLGPSLLGPAVFAWGQPWGQLACEKALGDTAAPSISTCLFPPQARGVLGIVGQLALALFMFGVGAALDWRQLRGKITAIGLVGVGVVAVPLAAAFAVAPALYNHRFVAGFGGDAAPSHLAFTLMVGAMLAVTAFPVAARILQEKGLTATEMGATAVAAAAVVTVLMFLALGVAKGVAAGQGGGAQALRVVGAAAFLLGAIGLARPLLARTLGPRIEVRGMDSGSFSVVLVVLLVAAYLADRIGINVIVGAFVAGAVMPARTRLAKDVEARVGELTVTLLLPVFLAVSGLQTDFTKLAPEHAGGLALFLVVGVVTKWAAGLVCARLGGLSWAEGNLIGVLMNCRGLLVLVVALAALNQGVISAPMQVGGVLMALVTTAMTGPLIDRLVTRLPSPDLPRPAPRRSPGPPTG